MDGVPDIRPVVELLLKPGGRLVAEKEVGELDQAGLKEND
jgi:hypothetical protein